MLQRLGHDRQVGLERLRRGVGLGRGIARARRGLAQDGGVAGGQARVAADQGAPIGLVVAPVAVVAAGVGQGGELFGDGGEVGRQRQLRPQGVQLVQQVVQRQLALMGDGVFQGVGVDEGVAVTVAADPRADLDARRHGRLQSQQARQAPLEHRQLGQESQLHERGGVVDLVGHVQAHRAQHARLPQGANLALQLDLVLGPVRGTQAAFAALQALGYGQFAVEDALAPHLGGVGGQHRGQHRLTEEGGGVGGGHGAALAELGEGVLADALPARLMVVGDIGQLGKDGETADQQARLVQGQGFQQAIQLRVLLAHAVGVDRAAADGLDQVENLLAFLLADHVAQQATQQAHATASIGDGGMRLGHGAPRR